MKNLGQMMKQAQEMQDKMSEVQEKLSQLQVTGAAGGGMIEVTMTGKHVMRRVKIDPELTGLENLEMLEDLLVAAVNDARAKVEVRVTEKMSEITGGLQLPAGFQATLLIPPGYSFMSVSDIDSLIQHLSKLPGLGPRSARRAGTVFDK